MTRVLSFMWKDGESGRNGCPTLYDTDGGYDVQGKLPEARDLTRPGYWVTGTLVTDPAELAQVRDLDADEAVVFVEHPHRAAVPDTEPMPAGTVVWVPVDVIDRLPVA